MDAKEVHRITSEIREKLAGIREEPGDEELKDIIVNHICADPGLAYRNPRHNRELADAVFSSLREDLGILQKYLEDDEVTEIMVNGRDTVFIEKGSRMIRTGDRFYSDAELEDMVRRVAGMVKKDFNELEPILDARLPDGSRVNAVYKNISLEGPTLTIRKFPREALNIEQLIAFGTVTQEAADYLRQLVVCGFNIFISGGTSSGKTTFLNCLTDFIPHEERIIVIEDSAELQVKNHENCVRLECKRGNQQGTGSVDMTDLIKTSLRMRPSRIIVGEVRGGEVADMISACNTGHDGSLSTGHGNSIAGMLKRLESMYLRAMDIPINSIRAQIAEGIDIIVHLIRTAAGERKVTEIAEVAGYDRDAFEINRLFSYSPEEGLKRTGNRIRNRYKLAVRGEDGKDGLRDI